VYTKTRNVVECMVLSTSNVVTLLLYVDKCSSWIHSVAYFSALQKWAGAYHVGSTFMVCVC
jgi:hypothetical protein